MTLSGAISDKNCIKMSPSGAEMHAEFVWNTYEIHMHSTMLKSRFFDQQLVQADTAIPAIPHTEGQWHRKRFHI